MQTFSVRHKSSPEMPDSPLIVNKTSDSVMIRWEPGYSGGSTQTFHIQITEVDAVNRQEVCSQVLTSGKAVE